MNSYGKIPFHLLFISDRRLSDKSLVSIVKSAFSNGLKAVQMREKDMPAGDLLKLAVKIGSVTKKYNAILIVNDRLDVALLSKAEGIHVPVNGMKIDCTKKFTKGLILGKSVHSLGESVKAQKEGFDYLLFGPVFRTPAKIKFGKPQGLEKLKQICSMMKIPVFVVGGITPKRAKKCLNAGAYGVAVIRPILKSYNLARTLKQFENEMGEL